MYKNNVTVIPYIPTTQNAISHPWKPETGMETVYFHTAISMTTTATAYNSFVMLKGEYDASVNVLLNGHGLEGIWYRNDKPDFTPVSMFNVQVDNMPTYREGAGGSYDITRTAIANELIKSSGNINALIQNGTVSDYATAKTKKQVQNFLQDPIVKQHIANNNVGGLKTDIANFQSENKYTIHEVDTKNVQLVPTEVNSRFNHDGGISESKKCTK